MTLNSDFRCRHFRGDKPCSFSHGQMCGPISGNPPDCGHYQSVEQLVLIIKLGALGDVLRTTSLLPAIEQTLPAAAVTWVTKPEAMPMLQGAGIHRILPWNADTMVWTQQITWDTVISLDKEEGPTALASSLRAGRRYGFGRNRAGFLCALSSSSEELFRLGIDDRFKFRDNNKTYPRLIADACELPWGPNRYRLVLSEQELDTARKILAGAPQKPLVGLNIGAGDIFAGKQWPLDNFIELAQRLIDLEITPVFLGGAREQTIYQHVRERIREPLALFPGCAFSLREFAALVAQLSVVVSGDSLAMHIALAQGVYAVTMFGSTTEREIEFFGHGEALIGRVPCAPCYLRKCPHDEICMKQIRMEDVLEAVQRGVNR